MSLEPQFAQPLPSIVAPPTIAFHPQTRPTPADLEALPCPNCGSTGPNTLVLTVDVQLPDNPSRHLRVLRCPACTAAFYDNQVPPDYAAAALNDRGRVPFYVQQGAGVSLITRPLAQLRHTPGAAYMEVGCGYGFGLDFAINTKGWRGIGIDPAPLAALGRDALQLPIELRYLRDDDEARGRFDVVMGSEVIEHVTSPAAFVRTLRAMLRPGGVMVLTTPNGDDIGPGTPPGIIIPLLSPGLHLVIQNPASLRALLQQAGFAHVTVEVDSHSLVAFASDAPLHLEHGTAALRTSLRGHLDRRADQVDPGSDLFLAFAGRAFMESVNDGAMEAADRAWAKLVPACRARYGIDLDSIALPPALASCGLEEMARLVPLNLAGLLLLRAIRRLAAGTPRPALEPQLLLAADAADAMRRALGELAMEDGQTEDLGWTARAEALLCAAEAGTPGIAARYAALPPAPNGGQARRHEIALRALAHLVNAAHYALAADFAAEFQIAAALPGADLSAPERDALFCLAVLAGRPGGDPHLALARFHRVRELAEAGTGLWIAALRGELLATEQAGSATAANALAATMLRDHPGVAFPPDILGWPQRDAPPAQPPAPDDTRRGKLLAGLDLARSSGVELGALDRPLVLKSQGDIRYIDYADAAFLRHKYRDDPGVRTAGIVEVDHVWGNRTMAETLGAAHRFDYALASHVVEHVPDLIAWLAELHTLLRPGATLRLAVPDKRYTFDILRQISDAADVITANVLRARAPLPSQIIDSCLNHQAVDRDAIWRGEPPPAPTPPQARMQHAIACARHVIATGEYIDVHCWVFTPASFAALMQQLCTLGFVRFACDRCLETAPGDDEFFVILRAAEDAAACAASWQQEAERLAAAAPAPELPPPPEPAPAPTPARQAFAWLRGRPR